MGGNLGQNLYNSNYIEYNRDYTALITTKAKRVGGSIMVTLPKHVVEFLGLREGDLVQVNVELPRKDFFGVLRGISKFTEDDRAEHG